MEIRLKFTTGKQKRFINKVIKASNLSVNKLAALASVSPRTIRDWRREKYNISLSAVHFFCRKFSLKLPGNEESLIRTWKETKRNSGKKGGLACYKRYGNPSTEEGTKKGGAKTLSILREKGIIPPIKIYKYPLKLNADLAEFVGLVLGDGGITMRQLCITLNSEKDTELAKFVMDLGEKLFGEKPKVLKERKRKALRLYYNGELLVKYLIKIGLKTGNKVKQQVGVPKWIKNSNKFRTSCLRGLMDTDGGVFVHKYKVNGKLYSYKKICFSNRSLPLLDFVYQTLEDVGFNPKLIKDIENKKVWLYNSNEVRSYLSLIGTRNPRLKRYRVL